MRKRTVKILKIIAVILIALSLIYAIAVGVSAAKLRKAYATLEKAGRPMNPTDVIPPDVQDAENAALLYESAILLLKAQPSPGGNSLEYLGRANVTNTFEEMRPPPDGNLLEYLGGLSDKLIKESIEPDELAELQQLIDQEAVNQALSVIEQGTRRPSCRFDRDYKAGFNMLMPNLEGFRNIIRIIGAKSCLEAQAGRPNAAWDLVQTQLRLADAMRNEPILIHFLVRLASIRTSCEIIHKICEISPPNSEQYHIIESLLFDYEDRTPLVLALDGERLLCGEWAFNLLRNGSDEDLKSLSASAGSGFGEVLLSLYSAFKPLSLADHAAYVRIMGEKTRLVQQADSPNEASAMIRKVEQTRSRLYVITSILEPAVGRVNELYAELIAQMRITRAGLALLQEKKAQSVFPETIEKLKIENLYDPFSKKLLRYKPQGQGFILYSVGRDEKDNDGSPRQKKQEKDWDIVWAYREVR